MYIAQLCSIYRVRLRVDLSIKYTAYAILELLEWDPHQCATPGNAPPIIERKYVNTTLNNENFNSNKNYDLALFLHVFRIICTNLISLHSVWLPSTAR